MRLYLSLLIFLVACQQEPPVEPTPVPRLYFRGISMTDHNGLSLNEEDSTDWRVDDTWLEQELGLFPPNSYSMCLHDGLIRVYPAFPNPVENVLGLYFVSKANLKWTFNLVDEQLVSRQLLVHTAVEGVNSIQLDVSSIVEKDTFRLYYEALDQGCVYRGHGDLLFQ